MEASIPIWWISLLLPILASILLAKAGRWSKSYSYVVALTLFIPGAAAMAYLASGIDAQGVVDPIAIDLTSYGVGSFYLFMDGLSAPVLLGISLVTALVAVYADKYMRVRIEEMLESGERVPGLGAFYVLYTGFAVAMLGMALSSNLIEFYVFLELSLITSFLLILYYGYGDRKRIAFLYFIWTHVAGALFLAGILYYGINAGSFDIVLLGNSSLGYAAAAASVLGSGARLAAYLVLLGLFIKMAVVGVHMWLPYAHAEAPTPVSALLSPNLIGIAGYALARFAIPLFPDTMKSLSMPLMALGLLTIIYGGLVALRQVDFKRFLAYSSVSQMGYLLLGIATLTSYGIAGAMLHYLSHAFGKAVLFMVAGVFITELHGLRDIRKMGGLARAYPLTAAAALLGFMHLVGMPPTLGMWSELLITIGVVKAYPVAGSADLALLALLLVIAFGISAGYAFITMKKIFYGQLREELGLKPGQEVLDDFKTTVIIVGVLGVFFFIVINMLASPLRPSTDLLQAILMG